MTTSAIERRRSLPTRFALWYIATYRARVSPMLGARCLFEPTCSQYGLEAYRKYGFVRATAMTSWRLLRCHPFRRTTGIYDPR